MNQPAVSVLMSVYNGQDYVVEAIESILSQTLDNFEFLIIDDGSTDKTPGILKKYSEQDKRIKILTQKNKGLVASLNRGIKAAKADLVARQDADDKSMPVRLEKQLDFLEQNPAVVIVGSSISVVGPKGNIKHNHALLLNDPELREELLVRSPFAHGSVMFRRQAALRAGLYAQEAWPAEDYDLWLRLSLYGRLANLDEYLYTYREHSTSISDTNTALQVTKAEDVRTKAWEQIENLLPKTKIDYSNYKSLSMGQLRIQRLLENEAFIANYARSHDQKGLSLKILSSIATRPSAYRKAAGLVRRKLL